MNTASPIGVFDSGIGGLTILSAIRQELPNENLLYFSDSANGPYGDKPLSFISSRCQSISEYFMRQQVKALVVACNTATAAAIASLRQQYALPVIGIEPGLKPAVSLSKTKTIGILATASTLSSTKFYELTKNTNNGSRILCQPCPGLVNSIEQGDYLSRKVQDLVWQYLEPLIREGADTLVLGCTHFPFIAPLIKNLSGGKLTIIETGKPVAAHLKNRLLNESMLNEQTSSGRLSILSSGHGKNEHRKVSQALQALSIIADDLTCSVEI